MNFCTCEVIIAALAKLNCELWLHKVEDMATLCAHMVDVYISTDESASTLDIKA